MAVFGNGADLAPPAAAFKASPLVIRPSRPVPATCPALILFSAKIFAADGAAALADLTGAAFAGAAVGAVAAGAVATAVLSILAINCSATTVPPSPTIISVKTPADGAGTSSTTLSVSISIKISS